MRRTPIEIDKNEPPRSIDQFSFVGSGSAPTDRKERTSEHHDRALAGAFAARQKTSR
jgi:hypothetical protein